MQHEWIMVIVDLFSYRSVVTYYEVLNTGDEAIWRDDQFSWILFAQLSKCIQKRQDVFHGDIRHQAV